MKTFIKIVLLSFLFIIGFSGLSQAQSGKGAYGNTISRRQFGSKTADYITRGLRFNADVCAGSNLDAGDVNVTAGVGYQFSPYVYLGGVIGSGYADDGPKVIVAADGRVYFTKKRVTPMLSAQLGYMLHADMDYVMSGYNIYKGEYKGEKWEYKRVNEHLVYASGGIGARIYLTKKLGFTARFMASTTCCYSPFLGLCAGIEF